MLHYIIVQGSQKLLCMYDNYFRHTYRPMLKSDELAD
jgi:hypothetical protein